MRILMIGDVVGRPGRTTVQTVLPPLKKELDLDLVVANGENAAGGFGLTFTTANQLFDSGVDVITSGNHIWDQETILPHLEDGSPILRPLNYPDTVPGKGFIALGSTVVVNLIGRVFVGTFDCPFQAIDTLLKEIDNPPKIVVIDMHAEATSEKEAIGWYLDGRVSAVVGTHTHVATADARILPKGTAFVNDVGMVGSINSIIGANPDNVLKRFIDQKPVRLSVAMGGPTRFNSILLDIDEATGRAKSISRVDKEIQ